MVVDALAFWATTFDFVGKALIAITALLTHRKLIKEREIDKIVLKDMRLEVTSGSVGLIFIIIGYILHLILLS